MQHTVRFHLGSWDSMKAFAGRMLTCPPSINASNGTICTLGISITKTRQGNLSVLQMCFLCDGKINGF